MGQRDEEEEFGGDGERLMSAERAMGCVYTSRHEEKARA